MANATKLRLLALNTNLYFTANKATAGLEDPAGQFIWMIDQLEKARANDEKVRKNVFESTQGYNQLHCGRFVHSQIYQMKDIDYSHILIVKFYHFLYKFYKTK